MNFKLYIALIILFASCVNKNRKIDSTNETNIISKKKAKFISKVDTVIASGKYYFDFDELTYYHNDISSDSIWKIYKLENKTTKEKNTLDILLDENPKSLNDIGFISYLVDCDFVKKNVPKSKFKEINEIFQEKKHPEIIGTGCIYEYRDILVFRKKSKVVGVAKICVSCLGHIIIGTTANTEEFGQSGDYENLIEILNR